MTVFRVGNVAAEAPVGPVSPPACGASEPIGSESDSDRSEVVGADLAPGDWYRRADCPAVAYRVLSPAYPFSRNKILFHEAEAYGKTSDGRALRSRTRADLPVVVLELDEVVEVLAEQQARLRNVVLTG